MFHVECTQNTHSSATKLILHLTADQENLSFVFSERHKGKYKLKDRKNCCQSIQSDFKWKMTQSNKYTRNKKREPK